MCLVPLVMLLMTHQPHTHQPWQLDRCSSLAQVEDRGQRMQEDYRLDYGVAAACEPDVNAFCAAEKVRQRMRLFRV